MSLGALAHLYIPWGSDYAFLLDYALSSGSLVGSVLCLVCVLEDGS